MHQLNILQLLKNSFLYLIFVGRLNAISDAYRETQIPYILSFLEQVKRESILDVGCGNGKLSWRVGNAGIGIDIDRQAIISAKTLSRRWNGDRDFVLASATNLPFRNNVFKGVLCSSVLQHVERFKDAIIEIGRVCNELVVINVPSYKPFTLVPERYRNRVLKKLGMINLFAPNELISALKGAGLRLEAWLYAPTCIFQVFYEIGILYGLKHENSGTVHDDEHNNRLRMIFGIARWLLAFFDMILPRIGGNEFIVKMRKVKTNSSC